MISNFLQWKMEFRFLEILIFMALFLWSLKRSDLLFRQKSLVGHLASDLHLLRPWCAFSTMLPWTVRMSCNMLEMSSIGLDKLEKGNADPVLAHHCIFIPLPSSGVAIRTLHYDLDASRNLPHKHIPKANPASRPRLVSLGHQGPLQFHFGFSRTILHTATVLVSLSSHSPKSSLPLDKNPSSPRKTCLVFPHKVACLRA